MIPIERLLRSQGLPGQTLLGHSYAITHCAVSQTAERFASSDAFGVVKIWDPRTAGAGAATSSAQTLLGSHYARTICPFIASRRVLAVSKCSCLLLE